MLFLHPLVLNNKEVRKHQKDRRARKKVVEEEKDPDFVAILYKNVSHQCCLLDSFHCSRPDSRNAVRARTPCAHLAGTLHRPPGHQRASGCWGRGTATKPGPEASSPTRPAGTAPHDALEAKCHWSKCHWSCCNICSETEGDGKKSGTHSFIRCQCVTECSPTDNSQR